MYKYDYVISKSKRAEGYKRLFIDKIPNDWKRDKENYEYLFIIGGDGTLLRQANTFINKSCKVILINGGSFGFFSSFNEKNIDSIFDKVLISKNYIHPQIIELIIDNKKYFAINDICIASYKTSKIDVKINENDYEVFKGTGFLFSTPLGSSAYNKSAGGAVIMNNIECLQMVEIHPVRQVDFNTLGSPIILSCDTTVTLNILDCHDDYYIVADGTKIDVTLNDKLIIKSSFAKALLYNPNNRKVHKIRKAFIKKEE